MQSTHRHEFVWGGGVPACSPEKGYSYYGEVWLGYFFIVARDWVRQWAACVRQTATCVR